MALSSLSWWAEDPVHTDGASVSTPRAVWYAVLALLILHATLAWVGRAPGILTGQDDVRYIVLARALSQGTYRDLLWPDAPLHHMYPPGYPAVLAGWRALGGEGFNWLIGLQVLLSTSALALLFDALRRSVAPMVALTTVALGAVNPSLLQQAGAVTSEPALMWSVALCVWASIAMTPGARRDAVVLLAAVLAPLMRTAGVIVPFAVIGMYAQQRRWRATGVAAVVGVPVVGVLLWWTLTDPQPVVGSSYAADLVVSHNLDQGVVASLIERLRLNFLYYMVRAVPSLLAIPTIEGTVVDNAIAVVALVVALVAGLYAARTRVPAMAWILLGTFALLMAWSWQIARYVIPVVPFIIATMLLGCWRIGRRWSVAAAAGLPLAAALATGAQSSVTSAQHVAKYAPCEHRGTSLDPKCLTDDQRTFFEAARFVRDSLPADVRVLSAKSASFFYYSGRKTLAYSRYQNLHGTELRDSALAQGAEYLTLSNLQTSERSKLIRVLIEDCHLLSVTREFSSRTLLLRWSRDSLPPAASACAALERYIMDPDLLQEYRELKVFKPKAEPDSSQ